MILLAAILGLLITQFGSGSEHLDMQGEKSKACNILVTSGKCGDLDGTDKVFVDIDTDNDVSTRNTLTELCGKMGITTKSQCADSCGCP